MATKTPNYSPEQTARLTEVGFMNQELSISLGLELGKTPASIRAKAVKMGLPYERKVVTTKSGNPVERKEAIVADISSMVSGNLDGLSKAPKSALVAIRSALGA